MEPAYKISFLEEALDDIDEAKTWYAEREVAIANRFTASIFSFVDGLADDVVRYRAGYRGLSHRQIPGFPYVIYFRKEVRKKRLIVVGVLHERRRRSALRGRK